MAANQTVHDQLLSDEDLEAETGIPRRTWGQYRYLGTGPAYVKLGKHVRYRRTAFDRWLDEQTVSPRGGDHGGPAAA